MMIRPVCAWYDFWVGLFWDRSKRRLYVLPCPCLGIVIQFCLALTLAGGGRG